MQERKSRRTNEERTRSTKGALVAAATRLFSERPFAEISTPDVVARAGVTRGALYHHFSDKQALFAAVVEAEAAAVAAEIETGSADGADPVSMLIAGGDAYLAAMAAPGRTRLLLIDAPAVLGRRHMDEVDARHGGRTLAEGLQAAMEAGLFRGMPLRPLAVMISAMFDRAAIALEGGADADEWRSAIAGMIGALAQA